MTPTRPADPPRTPLTRLVEGLTTTPVDALGLLDGVVVTGVALGSRSVRPGDLYVAAPGATTHGARFAADAVAAGAVAVLTDPAGTALCRTAATDRPLDVPLVVVPAPREVLGHLAARVYGHPAEALRLLGVTGTQGKTTVTRLAEAALTASGVPAAVVGTNGTRVAGEDVPSALTTPEATDLHALFAVMRERGVDTCAMEVSSHALALGRVDGVVVDVAAFTNLGRDHLDFHPDLEDYFLTKARLFTAERARVGLVNVDDAHGRRLAAAADIPVRTFSASGADADWQAADVHLTATGSRFTVRGGAGAAGPVAEHPVTLRLPGAFNVANALCALAALAELGHDPALVARGLGEVPGVPGRLEVVDGGQDFLAVVDYAHKPDAIEAVLSALRERGDGDLVVVLGAGGDRDRGKRRLMGAVAARLADVLVVTDDNPRSEDPAAIRRQVLDGAHEVEAAARADLHEVGDRREAIRHAVAAAGPGATVAVLGKGHETGQEAAGHVQPFDDRVVLREALRELAGERR